MREVVGVFLRLGLISFGGPAAHTALMRDELVRRRGWVDDGRFLDLMGATQLIPGPNSTELAIHLGHERAGRRGLVAAGVFFILPAALLVTALAWVYVRFGRTPVLTDLLQGVVPAVLAIILWALVPLLRTALGSWGLAGLAAAGLTAYLLGVNELLVLAAGGVLVLAARAGRRTAGDGPGALWLPLLAVGAVGGQDVTLARLFWTMLKIGSVLYGSGYVLLAFLEGDFVERLGWITRTQLLDAVSIGQVTPGPVFTTATFVGYLVAGLPGAFVATVAIFAPSFLLVGLLTRVTGLLRSRWWSAAILDGVNATSLALMAGVSWQLARHSIVDAPSALILLAGLLLLWRTRLSSVWLVLGGAVVGIAAGLA